MIKTADVVICGAGSAGVAVAYYLTRRKGIDDILVVDKHSPLMLTSAKSGENYRNWWPNTIMTRFMNRSIDLMEELAGESGNIFNLERRGYVYATCKPGDTLREVVRPYRRLDVGAIRVHEGGGKGDYVAPLGRGYLGEPDGADLLLDQGLIRENFPHFSTGVGGVIHARRCGALSAQQLGMYLLGEAKKRGARELRGEITAVERDGRGVKAVRVATAGGDQRIETRTFVNAAGPFAPAIAAMLAIELPLYSVRQQKVAIQDPRGVVPRDAPFTIFMDEQSLDWSEEEREILESEPGARGLLSRLPGGLHIKPEGGADSRWIKLGWALNRAGEEPSWEPQGTPEFPDLVIRGAAKLIPGLGEYVRRLPKPVVQYAGYYTRTRENLPLIGPLAIEGAYIAGGLSGFGTMASPAVGELAAAWVAKADLPDYAPYFSPERYGDPAFVPGELDGEL